MRILLAHNFYRTGAPGGEDLVFQQERRLLESAGHEVICYTRSNDEMDEHRLFDKARVLWGMQRSGRALRELRQLIRRTQPDVAHFHNTFPLISASGYQACASQGVPVVQTVHNFRLVCSSATHFRAGASCERCTPGSPWSAVRYGCYRDSRVASLAVASTLFRNHVSRIHHDRVTRFIALTQFSAGRLIAAGIPESKITVKPNFVNLPPSTETGSVQREKFIFLGRLAAEKGVSLLLDAWTDLPNVPLVMVGDGPLRKELEQRARRESLSVEFTGLLDRAKVVEMLHSAKAVVVPSLCLEGGVPLSLLEAMAVGVPVIASRLGGIPELVTHESNGLLFEPGEIPALRNLVSRLDRDSSLRERLARGASKTIREVYSPARNLEILMSVYADARGSM